MEFLSSALLGVMTVLYGWALYNLPALVVGIGKTLRKAPLGGTRQLSDLGSLPFISIIVAAKDEQKVIGRLLDRLVKMDYPAERYEVLVVEDGSTDRTGEICKRYADIYPGRIGYFHRECSNGKPAALNFALARAKGEIVGVLDADNVPDIGLLRSTAEHFRDASVSAVQGMTRALNADENAVSRLASCEEAAWQKIYVMGKDALGLFVPMTGSCGFVRKEVLENVGGWNEGSVTEDVELAARLVKNGKKIAYAPDMCSWQEYPTSIRQLVRQRTRWLRGYLETFASYGSLLREPNLVRIDAEMTLSGPLILNVCLLSYALAAIQLLVPIESSELLLLAANMLATATTLTLLLSGIALLMHIRPRRLSNLVWVPAVFAYWALQTLIAFRVSVEFMLAKRQPWTKTTRTGNMTVSHLNPAQS
jgi:cellulose synthase/poly-beta-1,6-N-acetylglucosamine synthase-like glycosyltransferase